MPDYLVLLIGRETEADDPDSDAFWDEVARYEAFEEVAASAIVDGHALMPSEHALTVRHDASGAPLVVDGPFAESTEVVGGFYVLDAEDRDAVIELARHIPAAATGALEIRELAQRWGSDRERPERTRRYVALLRRSEGTADAAVAVDAEALLSGGALRPPSEAMTLRVREGQVDVAPGPFDPSLEVVVGYGLLCADSPQRAAAIVADLNLGADTLVEVRPRVETID